MRRELLIWSFFILCLVVHSAGESTLTPEAEAGDHDRRLEQHHQLKVKDIYDMMTKSSREGHQRTYGKMHQVHHLRTSQKAKGAYGGASDLKRPRGSHNAASSVLVKLPTLFLSAVVSHVGLLIFSLY